MKKIISKTEIISLIRAEKDFLNKEFGVVKIGLFGSFARDQQQPESDIDFLVEFIEPRFEWLAGLQIYMEKKFDHKVELIRKGNITKTKFLNRLESEIIYA